MIKIPSNEPLSVKMLVTLIKGEIWSLENIFLVSGIWTSYNIKNFEWRSTKWFINPRIKNQLSKIFDFFCSIFAKVWSVEEKMILEKVLNYIGQLEMKFWITRKMSKNCKRHRNITLQNANNKPLQKSKCRHTRDITQ